MRSQFPGTLLQSTRGYAAKMARSSTMRIPLRSECMHMLADMEMPDHIKAHSLLVCQVALLLTEPAPGESLGPPARYHQAAQFFHR